MQIWLMDPFFQKTGPKHASQYVIGSTKKTHAYLQGGWLVWLCSGLSRCFEAVNEKLGDSKHKVSYLDLSYNEAGCSINK